MSKNIIETGVCSHCGAKMVEYTFTFNKGLARCLWKMASRDGFVEINGLGLTSSQWTNFQKLRYWDLIEKPLTAEGKGGVWRISEFGKQFVTGQKLVQEKVVMYRNERVRFEGSFITFDGVTGGYLYRQDYKKMASDQINS